MYREKSGLLFHYRSTSLFRGSMALPLFGILKFYLHKRGIYAFNFSHLPAQCLVLNYTLFSKNLLACQQLLTNSDLLLSVACSAGWQIM